MKHLLLVVLSITLAGPVRAELPTAYVLDRSTGLLSAGSPTEGGILFPVSGSVEIHVRDLAPTAEGGFLILSPNGDTIWEAGPDLADPSVVYQPPVGHRVLAIDAGPGADLATALIEHPMGVQIVLLERIEGAWTSALWEQDDGRPVWGRVQVRRLGQDRVAYASPGGQTTNVVLFEDGEPPQSLASPARGALIERGPGSELVVWNAASQRDALIFDSQGELLRTIPAGSDDLLTLLPSAYRWTGGELPQFGVTVDGVLADDVAPTSPGSPTLLVSAVGDSLASVTMIEPLPGGTAVLHSAPLGWVGYIDLAEDGTVAPAVVFQRGLGPEWQIPVAVAVGPDRRPRILDNAPGEARIYRVDPISGDRHIERELGRRNFYDFIAIDEEGGVLLAERLADPAGTSLPFVSFRRVDSASRTAPEQDLGGLAVTSDPIDIAWDPESGFRLLFAPLFGSEVVSFDPGTGTSEDLALLSSPPSDVVRTALFNPLRIVDTATFDLTGAPAGLSARRALLTARAAPDSDSDTAPEPHPQLLLTAPSGEEFELGSLNSFLGAPYHRLHYNNLPRPAMEAVWVYQYALDIPGGTEVAGEWNVAARVDSGSPTEPSDFEDFTLHFAGAPGAVAVTGGEPALVAQPHGPSLVALASDFQHQHMALSAANDGATSAVLHSMADMARFDETLLVVGTQQSGVVSIDAASGESTMVLGPPAFESGAEGLGLPRHQGRQIAVGGYVPLGAETGTMHLFNETTDGWTSDFPTGGFSRPTFDHAPGELRAATDPEVTTFGYWRSPQSFRDPAVEGLWRLSTTVRTSGGAGSAVTRLRASSGIFEESSLLVLTPRGGEFAPTGEHRRFAVDYEMTSESPAQQIFLDIIDEGAGTELAFGPVFLERRAMPDMSGARIEADLSFFGADHGWTLRGAPESYRLADGSATAQGLMLHAPGDAAEEDTVFGFWGSPEETPLVLLEAGRTYRANFTVASDHESPLDLPAFRMRLNDGSFEAALIRNIESTTSSAELPTPGSPVAYSLWFTAPPELDGEPLHFSFDFIDSWLSGNSRDAGLYLQSLVVESIP